MKKDEYIQAVTKQLRAHGFQETGLSDLPADEISPEGLGPVNEYQLFMRDPGGNALEPKLEAVVIIQVEEKSVDSLKAIIEELTKSSNKIFRGRRVDLHILLVSDEVTKSMEAVVERNTKKEYAESILPVLVNVGDMTINYEQPTGFGKSWSNIWDLSQNAEEYFQGV